MKTEKELNDDILKITMTIEEQFPELTKYLDEMPLKMPVKDGNENINKNLKDYYDSLEALYNNYSLNHPI